MWGGTWLDAIWPLRCQARGNHDVPGIGPASRSRPASCWHEPAARSAACGEPLADFGGGRRDAGKAPSTPSTTGRRSLSSSACQPVRLPPTFATNSQAFSTPPSHRTRSSHLIPYRSPRITCGACSRRTRSRSWPTRTRRRPTATPPLSRTIYRIWPDYVVRAHIDRSATTIKADAATRTYGTAGIGVVWAVIDSGIDKDHPHFAGGTLTDDSVAHLHRDFTGLLSAGGTVPDDPSTALTNPVGHGTHVAGIIAGAAPTDPSKVLIAANQPTGGDLPSWVSRTLDPGRTLSGMAPKAHLVSLKVLDANGITASSVVIAALAQVADVQLRRPPAADPRGEPVHRLRVVPRRVRRRAEPAVPRAGPARRDRGGGGGLGRQRWGGRDDHRRQHRRARAAVDHHRPGQLAARDHRWLDAPLHAAHLRRDLHLVQGPDAGRAAEAGPDRAG